MLKFRQKLLLLTIVIFFLFTEAVTADQTVDHKKFQLRASEEKSLCLVLKSKDHSKRRDSALLRRYELGVDDCSSANSIFWQTDSDYRIKYIGTQDIQVESSWCLTRGRVGGEERLLLDLCRHGFNTPQAWQFRKNGELHQYKGRQMAVHDPNSKKPLGYWEGSFEWLNDSTYKTEFCYQPPWAKECVICNATVEDYAGYCPEDIFDTDTAQNLLKDLTEPSLQSSQDIVDKPEKEITKPKIAGYFKLEKKSFSIAFEYVCLDLHHDHLENVFGQKEKVHRITHKECKPNITTQDWAYDFTRKAIFNHSLGKRLCMTQTTNGTLMLACPESEELSDSQRWRFVIAKQTVSVDPFEPLR